MSQLNRKQLRKMLLKEFRMMGMAPMGAVGDAPMGMHDHDEQYEMEEDYLAPEVGHGHSSGSVSKEDCCKAVLCLIECCDCPETKAKLSECCEEILATC